MTRQAASYRTAVCCSPGTLHTSSPARRPGPQHRRAGRREPRMEARPGRQQDVTREPAGHLPRRTPSGRSPGAAQHEAQVALSGRRASPGAPRHDDRAARHGRAAHASPGCSPGSTSATTSARDTRCSAGACPTSTCTPPTAPARVFALLHDARPVLLTSVNPVASTSLRGRPSPLVHAMHVGAWELPVIGEVAAPWPR